MQIALAGIGKIAVDQHVPAIEQSSSWELAATISRSGSVDGVPAYQTLDEMLEKHPDVKVVSLCLPPVPRFEYAQKALETGLHVMLEKPPGATLSEVNILQDIAARSGKSLFATWHSRKAKGVLAAKQALVGKQIEKGHINWKEDVRQWHPGQDWVFEPGGMGVFDPGINALSILTEILPTRVHLKDALLHIPVNRQTPIRAELTLSNSITAEFDWLNMGAQIWQIEIQTKEGDVVSLVDGGNRCFVNQKLQVPEPLDEYPALYAQMFDLVKRGQSDVDLAPMTLVADAMMSGRKTTALNFDW